MKLQALIEALQQLHNTHWDLEVVAQSRKTPTDRVISDVYFEDYECEAKIVLEYL